MKKWLRIDEAAAIYSLEVRWLRQACLLGKVRASKVGRVWFITPGEMDLIFDRGANAGKGFSRNAGRDGNAVSQVCRNQVA
ncbi:MAG: hypothetical protein PHV97_05345 [Candidatus Omnitrophica bacterium]|nr:hypothetical protein [Candidatus Omnitrophota bacterium]